MNKFPLSECSKEMLTAIRERNVTLIHNQEYGLQRTINALKSGDFADGTAETFVFINHIVVDNLAAAKLRLAELDAELAKRG